MDHPASSIQRSRPASWRRAAVTRLGVIAASLALSLTLISAASAGPSVEVIKWIHPDPAKITNFKVLLAADESEKSSPRWIDVGLPAAGDMYLWTLEVPEGGFVWVAVSAVDQAGRESDSSEWRRLEWHPPRRPLGAPARAYLAK